MSKRSEKTSPSAGKLNGQAINDSIHIVSLESIDFSTIDFESWFEDVDGKQLINVETIGKFFGKSRDDVVVAIRRHIKSYKGQFFSFDLTKTLFSDNQPQKINRGRKPKSYYLTRDGCFTFVDNLDYNEYEGDREKFIISFKRDLVETAGKVIDGKLVSAVSPPIIDKIEEKRKNGAGLTDQVKKWVTKRVVPRYVSAGKSIHTAYSTEFTKINEITAGYHERDLKNKLNSTGLDIQNATKLADVTCLKVGVVDDETRWKNVEEIIDDMYPNRFEDQIRLNEREMALIKRGCTKDQKSLFEFKQGRIGGGA